MEFDDHDEHEEEPGSNHANSVRAKTAGKLAPRYRECQKNHAVGIGGHALDGCGEFMPAGEENTLDALKCAACGCHRNFHRKESLSEGSRELGFFQHHLHPHHQQFSSPYYRTPAAGYVHLAPAHYRPQPALALPSTSGGGAATDQDEQEEDVSNPSGGGGGGMGKKRFRTKFTAEQKEKMLAFAESLGWRIQKHDEAAVEEFCRETCVKRQVLKVWMHNNKHTLDTPAGIYEGNKP